MKKDPSLRFSMEHFHECSCKAAYFTNSADGARDAEWVYNPSGEVESHHPMDRVGGPFRLLDLVDEDGSGDKWFIFAVVDSYFPIHHVVRGSSWENAYEQYIDYAAEHCHIVINAEELPDYLNEEGEFEGSYTSNGEPVETDNIQGFEVKLSRLEF